MSSVLSIIMPAYNEANHIQDILDKVCQVVLPYDFQKQLVVVNDGSSDETGNKVQEFIDAHTDLDIKLVNHEVNKGKGAGIRTALQYVSGDYIVIQDGDVELDPNDFVIMLKKMVDEDLPVLYGSRFLNQEKSSSKTFLFGNKLLSWTANLLYGLHITDEATCYKMFKAEVLKSIKLECNGFEFCPEVTAKVARKGYKIPEVPIHYYPRSIEQGKKIRARDGWSAICTLIKYRF